MKAERCSVRCLVFGASLRHDSYNSRLADLAATVLEEKGATVDRGAQAAARTPHALSAAARWLDAEDATMGHVLAWAVEHDLDTAARLVTALREIAAGASAHRH